MTFPCSSAPSLPCFPLPDAESHGFVLHGAFLIGKEEGDHDVLCWYVETLHLCVELGHCLKSLSLALLICSPWREKLSALPRSPGVGGREWTGGWGCSQLSYFLTSVVFRAGVPTSSCSITPACMWLT
ncbi:hypothetical protein mRhiFer1_008704 [Rhinolophus ferrumequinum]|uniref:Uncharacterized protein n=1 Tax=Rhinolophus ferrumequinum TaxID=59479 RepID=A0A7J7TRE0_RHIFE|nr:hypothetical protein mRhiFer1_008704 [Rhinolophus ferrumequinum]